MQQRNVSIDIIKCLAALLITNSHMELLYSKYSVLATGGAIGDVLFFFCSGFTLLMGRTGRFDNWYKRRINRIYPSVIAWALISSTFFSDNLSAKEILISGGGWFVSCIMIYYVLFYPIKRYLADKLWMVFGVASLIVLAWFYLMDRPTDYNMYGNTYFKWAHYFLFMLLGAIMGNPEREQLKVSPMKDALGFVVSLLLFYGIFFASKNMPVVNDIQYITLVPLLGITYYLFKLCNAPKVLALTQRKYTGFLITLIGGLCLEIYLVQYSLFTDKMNSIFPLNLVVMFIIILIVAYSVRCLSRIISQTFLKEDYSWKAILKL